MILLICLFQWHSLALNYLHSSVEIYFFASVIGFYIIIIHHIQDKNKELGDCGGYECVYTEKLNEN